jgi:hypothetical protein
VVGDASKIEWRLNLDVIAEGVLNGFAFEVFVGVGGSGDVVSKNESIK